MKALEILREEHDVMERVLDLLGRTISRLSGGKAVPEGFEAWTIEFFRNFADRWHHGQEEDVLFPLLEARGILREGGPIGVLLQEHDTGRDRVRQMERAIGETGIDADAFAAAATEYGTLLRQHIYQENTILFEMAKNCLSEEDAAQLLEKFHQAEQERGSHALHERFQTELRHWEDAFSK